MAAGVGENSFQTQALLAARQVRAPNLLPKTANGDYKTCRERNHTALMELLPASSEALVQTPIEPKLFFANERTYLHCARAHLPFCVASLDGR